MRYINAITRRITYEKENFYCVPLKDFVRITNPRLIREETGGVMAGNERARAIREG